MEKTSQNLFFVRLAGVITLGFLTVFFQNCQKNTPEPEPQASFTVESLTYTIPSSITFTNTSQNTVSYQWNFGDGQGSAERSPIHSYTQTGSYTVSLTATGSTGESQNTKQVLLITRPTDQWNFSIGGSGEDELYDMIATADGGYLAIGRSTSSELTDKIKSNNSSNYGWIVKISSDGKKEWYRDYSDPDVGILTSVAPAANGGYLLVGTSSIVKIDLNGVKQWAKTLSPSGLSRVVNTTDGGYLLAGSTNSGIGGDKSEPSQGKSDYWILKISANGARQWDKTFGGNDMDYLTSVINTADGGYLLSGSSNSIKSGDKSENKRGADNDNHDFWVVKVSRTGEKQWDRTYGGYLQDFVAAALATPDGGYLIGGDSMSGISVDKSEEGWRKQDFWIVKINSNGIKEWDKTYGGYDIDRLTSMLITSDSGFLLGGYSASRKSEVKSEDAINPENPEYWVVKINLKGTLQWDKSLSRGSRSYIKKLLVTSDNGYLLGGNFSNYSFDYADFWVVKIK